MFFIQPAYILITALILSPIIIQISIDSIKYYAVKYRLKTEDVNLLLLAMSPKIREFYERKLIGIYYNQTERSPEEIEHSLFMRRIFMSIVPLLFLVVDVVGLIRSIIINHGPSYGFLMTSLLIPPALCLALIYGKQVVRSDL